MMNKGENDRETGGGKLVLKKKVMSEWDCDFKNKTEMCNWAIGQALYALSLSVSLYNTLSFFIFFGSLTFTGKYDNQTRIALTSHLHLPL